MHQSEEQKESLMGRFNRSLMGMCVCVCVCLESVCENKSDCVTKKESCVYNW